MMTIMQSSYSNIYFSWLSNCYFNLRPNFLSPCFISPESKAQAQVRYDNEYIDGLLSLSVHRSIYLKL